MALALLGRHKRVLEPLQGAPCPPSLRAHIQADSALSPFPVLCLPLFLSWHPQEIEPPCGPGCLPSPTQLGKEYFAEKGLCPMSHVSLPTDL